MGIQAHLFIITAIEYGFYILGQHGGIIFFIVNPEIDVLAEFINKVIIRGHYHRCIEIHGFNN